MELVQSAWQPYINAIAQRAGIIMWLVPGLIPTSWYRDPARNTAANGDPHSQHLFALAVDFAGSEDALRQANYVARELGLIPVPEPHHLHTQLFPAGALARVGVMFPV